MYLKIMVTLTMNGILYFGCGLSIFHVMNDLIIIDNSSAIKPCNKSLKDALDYKYEYE